MDVDPNYDPSDFLMKGLPAGAGGQGAAANEEIHDDLNVSESDEEGGGGGGSLQQVNLAAVPYKQEDVEEKEEGDGLWF
ncbi:hypothetical protein LSTR_LSTR017213 [Laodelphax striatellus]|uniref:Uncharacterized protein n=1 Tax=Laodelphax striatellus TaxID=195883 RepID=A0A482XIJ5_LAOST|nr:hypothetical protein LSTR_LSTR017213 [Laodelphax striatellus]